MEKPKDWWDKLGVVTSMLGSLLVPLAIAFAGFWYSESASESQRRSDEAAASAQLQISRAELIGTLMKSLLSQNKLERELAIAAIESTLPDDAPALLRAIRESDSDDATKAVASAALARRREELIKDIHDAEPNIRRKATERLVRHYKEDPGLAKALVEDAERHPEDADGIHNAAVVLGAIPVEQLKAEREVVNRFKSLADATGDRTQRLFDQRVGKRLEPTAEATPR